MKFPTKSRLHQNAFWSFINRFIWILIISLRSLAFFCFRPLGLFKKSFCEGTSTYYVTQFSMIFFLPLRNTKPYKSLYFFKKLRNKSKRYVIHGRLSICYIIVKYDIFFFFNILGIACFTFTSFNCNVFSIGQNAFLENKSCHRKHHKIWRKIVKMDLRFQQKSGQQKVDIKRRNREKVSVILSHNNLKRKLIS